MVFVAVIGGSEWMRIPDQRVEIPYRCLHPRFFLLRLKHLEESAVCGRDVYIFWYLFSLIISLQFYTASHCTTVQIILIGTLLVITLKYHSAFHEQAWLCHLFSYCHNLPIKLQLSSTPQRHQKGLGLLVRERYFGRVVFLGKPLSAVFCSQVTWIYFLSVWMLVVVLHTSFSTLQYWSVSAAPPISL